MPRNLRFRVEVLFPVEDPAIRDRLRTEILGTYLADRVKARRLLPDGGHERIVPAAGEVALNAQQALLEIAEKAANRRLEAPEPPTAEEPIPTRRRRRVRKSEMPPAV
jgi:polyphosphate kinase